MNAASAVLTPGTRRRALVAGAAALLLLLGALTLPTAQLPAPASGILPTLDQAPAPPEAPAQRTQQPVAEQDDAADRPAAAAALHARYLALGARDPQALSREVAPVLAGCEAGRKAALLRALYESASPDCGETFLRVIRDSAGGSRPAEELASFAVRFLAARAPRDADARATLREAAFGATRPAPAITRWAAARFAATATAQELRLLPSAVFGSDDPLLADGVAAALAENPDRDAAHAALYALGRPLPGDGDGH